MKTLKPLLLAALLLLSACATTAQKPPAPDSAPSRLATAEAMFQERCKTAGERIHRTAENVEGVFLMKIRDSYNHYDQFRMDDPYGHDSWNDEYIKSFFVESALWANRYASPEVKERIRSSKAGYRYVEAMDPKDEYRYRYTPSVKAVGIMDATAYNVRAALKDNPSFDLTIYDFVLDKVIAPTATTRYGVTYDDISTHEERQYWIAGSSLKVIDLKTNEIMAERIGYMVDLGQGNNSGGRSPWLAAADHACPAFRPDDGQQPGFSYQAEQTRRFVTKVLHPIAEK